MPELFLLPSTAYELPSPSQATGHGRSLNTIIEEETEDITIQFSIALPASSSFATHQRRRDPPPPPSAKYDNNLVEQWLSPQSDNFPTPKGFPTPRGMHFLAAPVLSSSPSSISGDDSISTHSPATSSNPWNRASVATEVTEFDDIYDLTEDEENDEADLSVVLHKRMVRRSSSAAHSLKRRSTMRSASSRRSSVESRKSLTPLIIPSHPPTQPNDAAKPEQEWPSTAGMPDIKALISPVAPTPTATVEMSPAIRHFMQHQEVPTISAPPSLDGSLTSEQMAAMSAPPTPIIGSDPKDAEEWAGVQLQPGALATLNALSGGEFVHHDDGTSDDAHHEHPSQVIEVEHEEPTSQMEMTQSRTSRISGLGLSRASSINSEQRESLEGLTRLEIPSPGGFFAALSPRARHTWHIPGMTPDDVAPPTSTTAEQFYRTPWNNPSPRLSRVPSFPLPPNRKKISPLVNSTSAPIEQVVEVDEEMNDESNVPTARPTIFSNATEASSESGTSAEQSAEHPKEEVVPTEIVVDYDPQYARKQQETALSNLDRTGIWLMAQKAYMGGICNDDSTSSGEETDQVDTEADTTDAESESPPPVPPKSPLPSVIKDAKYPPKCEETTALSPPPQRKKTVRFSEPPKPLHTGTSDMFPRALPFKFGRSEGTFYRSFQDILITVHNTDAMVNGLPRFEAIQATRVALADAHRDRLLGKFQLSVVPQSAKKRMSANVARGDHDIVEDPERLRKEKESEARRQLAPAAWAVGAQKRIMGGRLLLSPAGKKLARQSMCLINGKYKGERLRILDFGGMATGDWAWHAAHAFPNTKVYTVALRSQKQLSNANIKGPHNHRTVTVARLTKLPFPDSYFDVISAREMHSMLHFSGENGADEWEGATNEVMRVLKPGGHFEFNLMDSDVVNPGPIGNAKSVEFGFVLGTLGYDPNPTRSFLGRLDRLGFEGVKRTWMVLPMGAKPSPPPTRLKIPIRSSSLGTEFKECKMEAMVQGSTDSAAPMTGLAGSWVWERWMLRAEMEKGAGELRLADMCAGTRVKEAGRCLDGIVNVVEEGRRKGSGWRCLMGYARKPIVPIGDEDGVIPLSLQLQL
ncbi:hypothetical protein MKZ38_008774 [Zalerion maritima]|uniref:Methyltransferase type 11 domain-containing protein n=1 Tax=Zalerion maritima TaxID=339359 RepID=A0AAD5WTU0_9PEZI|nr:hypothetical protein MKZ38_008774 [Zalerion maritima]